MTMKKTFKRNRFNKTIVFLFALLSIVIGDATSLKSPLLYTVGTMLILYSYAIISHFEGKLYFCTELLLLTLFTVYTGLSTLWAWNTAFTLYRFKIMFFQTVLVILLTNQFKRLGGYEYMIKAYVFSAMIMIVISVIALGPAQIINLIEIGGDDYLLWIGKHCNEVAAQCSTAGVILAYYALFFNKKRLLFLEIPFILIILATASRKGIVTLLVGYVLIIFFYRRYLGDKVYSAAFKLIIFSVVVLSTIQLLSSVSFFSELSNNYMGLINQLIGNSNQADLSTVMRYRMITVGWQQFLKTPILGIGIDNAKQLNLIHFNWAVYSHNNYIDLLVGGGIIAFLIHYGMMTSLLVKHIKRFSEKEPIVYISCLMILLRLLNDWGGVSYYSHSMIIEYPFWIAVANGFSNQPAPLSGRVMLQKKKI